MNPRSRPRGLSVPLVTPLVAGRVDETGLRRLVAHVLAGGTDIVFAGGTTGEHPRLDRASQRLVRDIAVDATTGAEAWVGITGATRAETVENLRHAVETGADAAVVAPLSIADLSDADLVPFFARHLAPHARIPLYLYDNADIAADPARTHLRVALVKRLARMDFVAGVKVSAPLNILGNYFRAALHFKEEWGLFVGNANLIFTIFRPGTGVLGGAAERWRRWLLQDHLPDGVVAGPANVFPGAWKRAWLACVAGDLQHMEMYQRAFGAWSVLAAPGGHKRSIHADKVALRALGVIESDEVAKGTPRLDAKEAATLVAGLPAVAELSR